MFAISYRLSPGKSYKVHAAILNKSHIQVYTIGGDLICSKDICLPLSWREILPRTRRVRLTTRCRLGWPKGPIPAIMRMVKTMANMIDCLFSDRQYEKISACSNLFKLYKYPGVGTAPIPVSKDERTKTDVGESSESLTLVCRWANSALCLQWDCILLGTWAKGDSWGLWFPSLIHSPSYILPPSSFPLFLVHSMSFGYFQ